MKQVHFRSKRSVIKSLANKTISLGTFRNNCMAAGQKYPSLPSRKKQPAAIRGQLLVNDPQIATLFPESDGQSHPSSHWIFNYIKNSCHFTLHPKSIHCEKLAKSPQIYCSLFAEEPDPPLRSPQPGLNISNIVAQD
jgi:hypothetical protein